MAQAKKKRRGRPAKPAAEKKRNNLTLRMRDGLRKSLTKQAEKNQRSLSEEAEFRLERSFQAEPIMASLEEARGILNYVALKVAPPSVTPSIVCDPDGFSLKLTVTGAGEAKFSLEQLLIKYAAWTAAYEEVEDLSGFLSDMAKTVTRAFKRNRDMREALMKQKGNP